MRLYAEYPCLEMLDYRALVGHLSPPSDEQIRAFAAYVSQAKSWYKHLQLWSPGEPFYFFIDPNAGRDRILTDEDQVIYIDRTQNTEKFHYTWMTTEAYRSKFGYLGFACHAGSQMMTGYQEYLPDDTLISGTLDNNPCRASVNGEDGYEYDIPDEVEAIGTIVLPGLIHPRVDSDFIYRSYARNSQVPTTKQGRESIKAKIIDICKGIVEEEKSDPDQSKDVYEMKRGQLDELIHIEQERIRSQMVATIRSVVDSLYG